MKKTMYAVITITDAEGKVVDTYRVDGAQFKSHTNNRFRIEIQGLLAENYDHLITCEIYSGTTRKASVTDSVGSYLSRAIQGNGGEVYEAAMRYCQTAKTAAALS